MNHPQIVVLDPTYFLGVAQLAEDEFMIFGPATPIMQTPEEIRQFSEGFGLDKHLTSFVNSITRTPMMGFRAFTSAFCIAIYLLSGKNIDSTSVYLCNNALGYSASCAVPSKKAIAGLYLPTG